MKKHIKRVDFTPRGGLTIPLTITHVVALPAKPTVSMPKVGKQNYLGKHKSSAKTQPSASVTRRTATQGRYVGTGKQLTAFVWLEEDPTDVPDALATRAANDANM